MVMILYKMRFSAIYILWWLGSLQNKGNFTPNFSKNYSPIMRLLLYKSKLAFSIGISHTPVIESFRKLFLSTI